MGERTLSKEKAFGLFIKACASPNTYKTTKGWGPGGIQLLLSLPEVSDVAGLFGAGDVVMVLMIGGYQFKVTESEGSALRSYWEDKNEKSPSIEYIESRL